MQILDVVCQHYSTQRKHSLPVCCKTIEDLSAAETISCFMWGTKCSMHKTRHAVQPIHSAVFLFGHDNFVLFPLLAIGCVVYNLVQKLVAQSKPDTKTVSPNVLVQHLPKNHEEQFRSV